MSTGFRPGFSGTKPVFAQQRKEGFFKNFFRKTGNFSPQMTGCLTIIHEHSSFESFIKLVFLHQMVERYLFPDTQKDPIFNHKQAPPPVKACKPLLILTKVSDEVTFCFRGKSWGKKLRCIGQASLAGRKSAGAGWLMLLTSSESIKLSQIQ